MNAPEQPSLSSLFPEPYTDPVDAEQVAAKIAEKAPRVEHPDRTSKAAEDQGWGPVEDRPAQTPRRKPLSRKPPQPIGPVRGDSEWDTGPPDYYRPIADNTPTETEESLGKAALQRIRRDIDLKSQTPHNQ